MISPPLQGSTFNLMIRFGASDVFSIRKKSKQKKQTKKTEALFLDRNTCAD